MKTKNEILAELKDLLNQYEALNNQFIELGQKTEFSETDQELGKTLAEKVGFLSSQQRILQDSLQLLDVIDRYSEQGSSEVSE